MDSCSQCGGTGWRSRMIDGYSRAQTCDCAAGIEIRRRNQAIIQRAGHDKKNPGGFAPAGEVGAGLALPSYPANEAGAASGPLTRAGEGVPMLLGGERNPAPRN